MGNTTIHIDEKLLEGVYIRSGSGIRNRYAIYARGVGYLGSYHKGLIKDAVTQFTGNISLLEQRVKDLIAIEEL